MGLLALGLALLLAVGWLGVRGRDMAELTLYLVVSLVLSLGIGRLGLAWLRRAHVRLWLQVTLTYMLGIAVAILNIFLTAQLMFISSNHDLPLLVLLLLFAAVVSLALGFALAQALARRVTALHQGARAIANGDLQAHVDQRGSDELAALGVEFNRMASQLAAAAAERQRLEGTRRDLIAAISHDLRTPLASLRVMTEALADGMVDDPATTTRYLTTMRSQIGHLNGLIDDLFELAQIDAGALKLELVRGSLGDLVSDTLAGMQPQADAKGVRLAGHVAPGVDPVLIAPQKIGRVLYNLVDNALRHTPAAIGRAGAAGTDAVIEPGDYVLVTVADTGSGIPAEHLPRLFERFYRVDKARSLSDGGTGLGLAIVKSLVDMHGGSVDVASEVGRGTTFRVTLPTAELALRRTA